jgi:hypothetical protein
MRSIKEALLERSYAQTDAAELAKVDPDIDYNPTHNSFLYLGEAHVRISAFGAFSRYFTNRNRTLIPCRTERRMKRMLRSRARVRWMDRTSPVMLNRLLEH